MADPLSVSASIAGLMILAESVFCRTVRYVKDVKGAPKQIAALSGELGRLYGILVSLNVLAPELDVGLQNTTIQIGHVHACHHTLKKIKALIEKHEGSLTQDRVMESLMKRMKWPFSITEAKDLLAEVEGHKSTLSLALTADGLTGILRVLSEQNAMANEVSSIRQDLRERREAETRIALSEANQAILDTLSSIDPHESHRTNLKLRHFGTGHWFTSGDDFNHWLMTPKSLRLWLYGIPGAGKTILCSSVIEIALARSNRDIAVAFFYCDYKDTTTQDPSNILGSLAKQIAKQDEQSFEKLRKLQQSKARDGLPCVHYDPEELRVLIVSMASNYDHTMIVVDGLDECGGNTRAVVDLLASLNADLENCNIKTLFLSRQEQDIQELLKDHAQVSIAANVVDLRLYVGAEIEMRTRTKQLRIKDQSMKDHIMERLVGGAEGMFRWVTCQMDYLCELTNDTARRKALNSLPPTLNATYERILRKVNHGSQDAQMLVQRTLRWIMHSHTSLSIAALSEAVSINFGDRIFDRDAVPHEDEILRYCSSLVRRSAVHPGLELAHFTVKEFLLGLEECPSHEFEKFRIQPVDTNIYLAEVCLTYLNLQDFSNMNFTVEGASQHFEREYAFREYAVKFWMEHSRKHLAQATILSLVQKLLHPMKPNTFLNWAREYAQRTYKEMTARYYGEGDSSEDFLSVYLSSASPLHYAAMLALPSICDWLVNNGCQINQQSGFGNPLHCALLGPAAIRPAQIGGHIDRYSVYDPFSHIYEGMMESTVEIILGAGADVNYPYSTRCLPISPLFIAVCQKYWTTSAILLEKGARMDKKTVNQLKLWSRGNLSMSGEIGEPAYQLSDIFRTILRKLALASDTYVDESVERSSFSDANASFRIAAEFGQVGVVKSIVHDASFDINSVDESSGCTALHYATAIDHAEIVELLLKNNADCSAIDNKGNIALHHSVRSGGWHCLSMLLKQDPNVSLKTHAGFSVWHLAAIEDNIKALEVLERFMVCCKRSIITVAQDRNSLMPSHTPDGSEKPAVPTDFYKGQDVAIRSLDGATPIHVAARAGSVRAVRFFIDNGFDTEALTSNGSSALHCAVENGFTVSDDIVRLLLEVGVDPHRARVDGMAPIHVFIESILETSESFLSDEQRSVLRRFAQCAAALHQSNIDSLTALHQICQPSWEKSKFKYYQRVSVVEILLGHGADPQDPDGLGRIAFDIVVDIWKEAYSSGAATVSNDILDMPDWQQHVKVISLFLDSVTNGVTLTKMCNDPYLLFLSIRFREEELAHKLLDRYHDVDCKADQRTPLSAIQAACRYGCSHSLLEILINKSRLRSDPTRQDFGLIHEACTSDHTTSDHTTSVRLVVQLLRAGIDPNGRSLGGETALMVAARTRNPALIDTLLFHNANPFITDNRGWGMVHHACASGNVAVLPILKRLSLDWTATVRAKIGWRWLNSATALHIAASRKDTRILEYILDNECVPDIDSTAQFTITALFVASYMGREQNVALLLFRDADATIRESSSPLARSPLHVAAELGHTEVVMAFVNHGCDTQIKDRLSLTPESIARRGKHLELANLLEGCIPGEDRHHSGAKPYELDSELQQRGRSEPLKVAIETQDLDLCQRVVQLGTDLILGYPSCDGCTPLLYSLHHENTEIASYLIEQGAEIAGEACAKYGSRGYTVFHYAASFGWVGILTLLLRMAPEQFVRLHSAVNPLHLAVANGQVECCRLILGCFDQGETCFTTYRALQRTDEKPGVDHWCSGRFRSEEIFAKFLANLPVQHKQIRWSWFLNHGESFPSRLYSATPLQIAADGGYAQIVQMLIDHGSLINAADAQHRTALDYAAAQDHTEVVKLLLQNGANSNAVNGDLKSPLMAAARRGNVASCESLLQSGADSRMHDNRGRTVLHHAAINVSDPSMLLLILNYVDDHGLGIEDHSGESPLVALLATAETPTVAAMLNYAPHPSVYIPGKSNVLTAIVSNNAIETSALRRLLRRVPPELAPKLLAHRALCGGTPLYAAATIAASHLQGDFIDILLYAGAELELEGGAFGTALMGACGAGRLEAVKILISKGAAICYRKDGEIVSALRASEHFPDIKRWLLVRRFTEGPKLLKNDDGGG